jgi:hypothetical protein
VHVGGVLHHDHVLTFGATEAELGDRRGAVGEQPGLVVGVHPRAGDDARAVHRPEVVLEVGDDLVDDRRIEQTFLGEEGLHRRDASLDRRERRRVMPVSVILAHPSSSR